VPGKIAAARGPIARAFPSWAGKGWRPYALLGLLCLGLYLPGMNALPVTDRDEARFAQATRQMIESGDYLHIRFQDEARNRKPAGIYWLQALSVSALSGAERGVIWPYRLPSLLGAVAAVFLTFALGRNLVGYPAAFLGAALLAGSLTLVAEAHLAKTDAVLLGLAAAAQLALGRIYCQARGQGKKPAPWPWALLFWAALGGAALVKGPVAPLLALLTALCLTAADREARWLLDLRPLWGAALLLAMVGPWLFLISRATDGAFLSESLGHDFLGKLVGAQEGHGMAPGAYTLLLPLTFWPGSLFLAAGLLRGWRERARPAERFLLAWAVPFWIVLELIPTKLPHYLLPAYPALALLAAAALVAGVKRPLWFDAASGLLWAVASLSLAAVLIAAPMALGHGLSAVGAAAAAIVLLMGGALLYRFWRQPRPAPGLAAGAAILALLTLAPAAAVVAPNLDRLWLSRSAAELVRANTAPDAAVAVSGYDEPSLVFLLGTATKIFPGGEAARFLTAAPGAMVLVEDREEGPFHQALAQLGKTPHVVGRVAGLDYSNGKLMVLTLYAAP
jgi:4-amino-4-deoxy-L-arabinose transferase-like glycosyltransferase